MGLDVKMNKTMLCSHLCSTELSTKFNIFIISHHCFCRFSAGCKSVQDSFWTGTLDMLSERAPKDASAFSPYAFITTCRSLIPKSIFCTCSTQAACLVLIQREVHREMHTCSLIKHKWCHRSSPGSKPRNEKVRNKPVWKKGMKFNRQRKWGQTKSCFLCR